MKKYTVSLLVGVSLFSLSSVANSVELQQKSLWTELKEKFITVDNSSSSDGTSDSGTKSPDPNQTEQGWLLNLLKYI